MPASNPSEHPRTILQRHGLAANRNLGQNFLVSTTLMDRIVNSADIAPQSVALEIGTGLGRLTERLCRAARAVISVEIDKGLWELAGNRLSGRDNLRLLHLDFLENKHTISPAVETNVEALGADAGIHVVSNLPYQISSPAIINLLEWDRPVVQIDVMLQAEVVDRLLAAPGTSEYGPLTVTARYHAMIEPLMTCSPSDFWPRPRIQSKFIRLVPSEADEVVDDYAVFQRVVQKLFQSRRKTIYKGISLAWGKPTSRRALDELGWEGRRRPAKLSVDEFIELSNAINTVK
jgi:16S rRNA (adenine1518-N6/adenine1519-N6)-dimethyltransferase